MLVTVALAWINGDLRCCCAWRIPFHIPTASQPHDPAVVFQAAIAIQIFQQISLKLLPKLGVNLLLEHPIVVDGFAARINLKGWFRQP